MRTCDVCKGSGVVTIDEIGNIVDSGDDLDDIDVCPYCEGEGVLYDDGDELDCENEDYKNTDNEIDKIGIYDVKSNKCQNVNFNTDRKVQNRKDKEKNRLQYYYAQENSFSKLNNKLPEEFTNKIICGDSLGVLQFFPDNSIDLIFTSPPYNFGLEYDNQDDAHFWGNYFQKLFAIFDECIRIVKFGGRIVINVQPLFSDYIPSHHIISNHFISRKMIWRGEIIWEKK
jgi:hypothetical protein